MKKQKQRTKQAKPVLGFYRDRDGETKPITKSVTELNRKKVIKNAHGFKGVNVVTKVRERPQVLEDLLGEFHLTEDHLERLREQQTQLQAEGKESAQLDAEITKTSAQLRLLKAKIKAL